MMIHLMRLSAIIGADALVFISASFFMQAAGQELELPPISLGLPQVVLASPLSSTVPGGNLASIAGAVQPGSPADVARQKVSEISEKVRQTLALGRPKALAKWIADLSEKKK